jgi:nucleolin
VSSVEILKNKTKRPSDADAQKKGASVLPKAQAKAAPKKVESDSDDESEEVVKKPAAKTPVQAKAPAKKQESDSDDESEEVVKKPAAKTPVQTKAPAKKQESDSDDESEEVVKKPAAKTQTKAPAKKQESDSDEDSDEEEVKKPAAKTQTKAPAKKQESDSEDEESIKVQPKATPKVQESGCSELFCKNLSWNTDENLLGEFFGKYGEVTNVKVLYDKNTGKARGLAFVEFSSRADAQKALDDASNLNVDGRLLQVTFSDQKPERPQGGNNFGGNNRGNFGGNYGGNNRGGSSNYSGEKFTAFVGNLGFKTSEINVKKFFSDCGGVIDVRIAKNEEGRSKGFCHVDFDSADAVEKAKAKAGQQLDGREIRVDASTPRQGGGQRGGFGGRGGRGGRGGGRGGNFNPMDRAKKSGAIISNPNAVQTFEDDD